LLEEGAEVFRGKRASDQQRQAEQEAALYEQIGRLKMELEWLKKKWNHSVEAKRMMIEPSHPRVSVRRQCELVGLNRSTFYRQSGGETPLNLQLMRVIDEEYTRAPFYGYRK